MVDAPFELKAEQTIPLAPGLFVDVELDAAQRVTGVRVPRSALRNGNQVYVLKIMLSVFVRSVLYLPLRRWRC